DAIRRLAVALETTSEAVLFVDLDGSPTYLNGAARRLFWPGAGDPPPLPELLRGADLLVTSDALHAATEAPVTLSGSVRAADGRSLVVSVVLAAVPDDHGHPAGIAVTIHDVSEL